MPSIQPTLPPADPTLRLASLRRAQRWDIQARPLRLPRLPQSQRRPLLPDFQRAIPASSSSRPSLPSSASSVQPGTRAATRRHVDRLPSDCCDQHAATPSVRPWLTPVPNSGWHQHTRAPAAATATRASPPSAPPTAIPTPWPFLARLPLSRSQRKPSADRQLSGSKPSPPQVPP